MSKKRFALFINSQTKDGKRGWFGFRGLFFSQRAAETSISNLANKNNNLAEIVDFETLTVLKVLKKDAGNEWK